MLLNTGARTDDDDDDAKRSDHTQMTEYTLDDYDDDDDAKNEAVGDYHSSVCGVKSPNWSNYSSRHHSYIISIYSFSYSYGNDLVMILMMVITKLEMLEITVSRSAERGAV